MFKFRVVIKVLLLASCVVFAPILKAGSKTVSLTPTINIVSSAVVDTSAFASFSAGTRTFSLGDPRILNLALGSIGVQCSLGIVYKIGLDKGLYPAAGMRRMSLNGIGFIPYIFRYNGNEWGDADLGNIAPNYVTTYPQPAITAIGTGSLQTFTLYGDAWIENATLPGIYTDTLTVTLVW